MNKQPETCCKNIVCLHFLCILSDQKNKTSAGISWFELMCLRDESFLLSSPFSLSFLYPCISRNSVYLRFKRCLGLIHLSGESKSNLKLQYTNTDLFSCGICDFIPEEFSYIWGPCETYQQADSCCVEHLKRDSRAHLKHLTQAFHKSVITYLHT